MDTRGIRIVIDWFPSFPPRWAKFWVFSFPSRHCSEEGKLNGSRCHLWWMAICLGELETILHCHFVQKVLWWKPVFPLSEVEWPELARGTEIWFVLSWVKIALWFERIFQFRQERLFSRWLCSIQQSLLNPFGFSSVSLLHISNLPFSALFSLIQKAVFSFLSELGTFLFFPVPAAF